MSSAIRCVSCKQKINLAPGASGTIACPMCKTQQPVPTEQGQHAPDLDSSDPYSNARQSDQPTSTQPTADPFPPASPVRPGGDFPEPTGHQFDSGGGCGCLLAAALLAASGAVSILLVFAT